MTRFDSCHVRRDRFAAFLLAIAVWRCDLLLPQRSRATVNEATHGDRHSAAARPDDARPRRRRDNARLRANYPAGFALDATHHPHITLLQRYVRTEDLDKVFAGGRAGLQPRAPDGLGTRSDRLLLSRLQQHRRWPASSIEPTPELRRLQQEIVDAVAAVHAAQRHGRRVCHDARRARHQSADAGVRQRIRSRANRQELQSARHDWRRTDSDFVKKMEAAPFPTFKFKIAGAAVFHLGQLRHRGQRVVALAAGRVSPQLLRSSRAVDPLPSWNEGPAKVGNQEVRRAK